MRLNLNLATQPYAEVRRFMMRWTVVLALVFALTVVLVYMAGTALKGWNTARQKNSEIQAKIAERDQLRAQAQGYLAQPQNRDTRDRSQFLNELIARKAFSWTQVFSDLERLMPVGLHVVSVTPAVNDDNQLEVRMMVNGRSRDRAIELVKRLEDSKHFAVARITDERLVAGQAGPGGVRAASPTGVQPGDTAQFQISAVYVPGAADRGGKP